MNGLFYSFPLFQLAYFLLSIRALFFRSKIVYDMLTKDILHFQRTGQGFPKLLEKTSLFVYRFLKKKSGLNEDDKSDFFCQFYPKIPVMFHRFVYRGKPFSVYLIISLKWQLRSFIRQKRRHIYQRDIIEQQYLWQKPYCECPLEVREPLPELTTEAKRILGAGRKDGLRHPVHSKRLLFLAMKGSMEIDDHITECIAIITGYEKNWLYNCILRLKLGMEKKRKRLELLRKKRNWYFTRIFIIHSILIIEKDPLRRNKLFSTLREFKTYMRSTLEEIAKIPIAPTHQEIADVLGIPKGSVDSGLYYVKNAFEKLYAS